jgi:hypothetical protein
MKKIKLIRKYPGSPKLGTELTPKVDKENYNTNNFYWEGSWFNPNDFCEFWEEIVEPDYEILSFINKEGDIIFTLNDEGNYVASIEIECFYSRYTLNEMLNYTVGSCVNSKKILIHSIKRLSDGEIFTVGDTIKTHKYGSNNIINEITMATGSNYLRGGIWLNCEGGSQHFSYSIKVIKKDYEVVQVLYATEIRTLYDGEYRILTDGIGFDLDYLLNNGGRIHSVKRLSDGEVFTVGDRINIGEEHQICIRTISMINISSDGTLVIDHEHGGLTNGKDKGIFHRIKQAPLNYEILSYVKKDRPNCITNKKRGGIRHDEFWNIHSVKRLSDGEIFTLGDTINFNGLGKGKLLEIEFEIALADKGTGKLSFVNDSILLGKWWSINELKKIKTPLFKTEDGVDIYVGDETWILHKNSWHLSPKPISHNNESWFQSGEPAHWSFSNIEAAMAYMLNNKPCLSLDDIIRSLSLSTSQINELVTLIKYKL